MKVGESQFPWVLEGRGKGFAGNLGFLCGGWERGRNGNRVCVWCLKSPIDRGLVVPFLRTLRVFGGDPLSPEPTDGGVDDCVGSWRVSPRFEKGVS